MSLALSRPIETPRLIVRCVAEPDLPALLEVNADDEVTRYLPYATWRSSDDADAWYTRMSDMQASGTALQLVVFAKQAAKAIGTCLVFRYDEGSARAELGYVLGRAHGGRGYMREALGALIDRFLVTDALRRFEAEVDPRNVASTRLLRRLGFTQEGLLRQRWMTKGEGRDVAMFGLLRDEWPAAAHDDTSDSLVGRGSTG